MSAFDYKTNNSWGNSGWLGSDDYYVFWARTFAHDLEGYFRDKTIMDIGAGNGRIWQEALALGLDVKMLHLIDPALDTDPGLAERDNVAAHRATAEKSPDINADVAVFKQSIHHVYAALGPAMFDRVHADVFINFSMPLDPEWPMSPALKEKYRPSVTDVDALVRCAGREITRRQNFSYPVRMSRGQWCDMLRARFSSILHDCDDSFIKAEVHWAHQNLPDYLAFDDTLECLVF